MATDGYILELDRVVAGYGAMTILNALTMKIRRGVITTIIGPNGACKSTVFKTVFGLIRAREGHIRFDGSETTDASTRELLDRGLCYVPQGRNIFPTLSVRHNLELGAAAAPKGLAIAGRIERAMQRFPMLAAKSRRQASTLSGGEQKLLEIARGLLLDPKLVLIDEPSIGLSPIMVRQIFQILDELRSQGTSILMVEQNARSALQISDDGVVLEQGRLRMQASAKALLDDPRVGQLFLGGTSDASAA